MATPTRPEGALYRDNVDRIPQTTKTFYAKHLLVGIFGEAITRKLGLEDTLSITAAAKRFDDYTGISDFKFIPGVNGQETTPSDTASNAAAGATAEAATEAATEATATIWSDYTPTFATDGLNSLHTHVWTPIATTTAPATAYLAENSDWIVEVGCIALVAAAINRASQSRPKNTYVRNGASILGGAAVVFGTKLALSYAGYAEPIAFAKTVDMGARILATHYVLKHATPLAQRVLSIANAAIDPLRAPYAAEQPLMAAEAS